MRGTLRTRRHFARVYENGRKAVGTCCVVYVLRPTREDIATHEEHSVGVVASKKVGNAVRRNRAKRILREAHRALQPRLCSPLWTVLIARAQAAEPACTTRQMTQEMEDLFRQLECIAPRAEKVGGEPC